MARSRASSGCAAGSRSDLVIASRFTLEPPAQIFLRDAQAALAGVDRYLCGRRYLLDRVSQHRAHDDGLRLHPRQLVDDPTYKPQVREDALAAGAGAARLLNGESAPALLPAPAPLARGDGPPQRDPVRVMHDRPLEAVLGQGAQDLDQTLLNDVFQVCMAGAENGPTHAAHRRRDGLEKLPYHRG